MMGERITLRPGAESLAVDRAAALIKTGGVIVYPTETLYGLGADAGNREALRRVYDIKGREGGKPLLIIVDSFDRLEPLVKGVTAQARLLIKKFWPGPLTLVFSASANVPDELTAGAGTIGARVPSHEFCRALVRAVGRPITSTSANRAGERTPDNIPAIKDALPEGIDLYVDAGVLPSAAPSTVVDVSISPPRLLREGAVPWAQIEHILH
jgi:L-threonylcarbamoyladenylate synthase